jgi:HSP20 family protein
MPKVDVIDRETEFVVRAVLPGVGEYLRHEVSRGEFQRTLQLPETVDEEKASETLRNGVLEVTLPLRMTARA